MKWDGVVLTASDESQKKAFEMQLEVLPQLKNYAEKYFVFEDTPANIRIGSGGSTILALNQLSEYYGKDISTKRLLIIHSGGLSQRLPVASALGKVFLLLPGEKTMLEMKLLSYRPILNAMSAGVVIAASDTLEYIPQNIGSILPGEVTLFAHPSSIRVAMEHGVYVLKDGSLQTVLQKPTLEELRSSGALKPNSELAETGRKSSLEGDENEDLEGEEHALTDSFFLLSPSIALRLASLKEHEPLNCETCCYGDFLRTLGALPQLNYLEATEPLGIWRQRFASVFRGLSCRVVVLPQNSFFHFGTPSEVMEHLRPGSTFCRRFGIPNQAYLYSSVADNSKVSETALIEWCDFPNGVEVGAQSLVSGLQSSEVVHVPEGVMATAIIMRNSDGKLAYITAIFGNNDDIKEKKNTLKWFNVELNSEVPLSLWMAKIFQICPSMQESIKATLLAMKEGRCTGELISMSEAVRRKDVVEMVNFRRCCMASAVGVPGPTV